jgi:hypothetical protein
LLSDHGYKFLERETAWSIESFSNLQALYFPEEDNVKLYGSMFNKLGAEKTTFKMTV